MYPKVGVTTVILRHSEKEQGLYEVLMIQRGKDPDMGKWSLPGGHLEWGETVKECAMRETEEEVCIPREHLIYSEPMSSVDTIYSKDKTTVNFHFVNVSCCALARPGRQQQIDPKASTDAMDVHWFTVTKEWTDSEHLKKNDIIPTIAEIVIRTVKLLTLDRESNLDEKFIQFPMEEVEFKEKRDKLSVNFYASPMSPALLNDELL
jgi:8-oxo-dGTP diphosphatase